MIVISGSVVLTDQTIDGRNPRIGYHNLVTVDNVFADQEDTEHRATQVANPATYLYWSGVNTDAQTIGIQLSTAATVNYVGIARHNFGSTGAQYIIESSSTGSSWNEITEPRIPVDDGPLIHEFEDTFDSWFRVSITPGSGVPEIAVLYFGQILRMQRRIYVGHTVLQHGRDTTVSTGFSEEGQFLGRVVRRRMYSTSVEFQNLTPTWYRDYLDPFIHAAVAQPYFWAWRPATYANETGYAWMTGDAKVTNQLPNGFMSASWQFQGIR